MSTTELTSEQLELLYDARRCWENGEDPVVVPESSIEAVREVLNPALRSAGVSSPESLSLDAISSQFAGEAEREEAVATLGNQHPETGGVPEDETDEDEPVVETLSARQAKDAYDDLRLADTLEQRGITARANEIREELATDLGIDPAEVPDRDELQEVLG